MLAMPTSSLQALLCSLRTAYPLSISTFVTLLRSVADSAIFQMRNTRTFVLHNISPSIVNHDISVFLEHYLGHIGQIHCLDIGWPGAEVIRTLVKSANGLFIWAATACRFICDGKRFAPKRLNLIVEGSTTIANASEKHLNEIYVAVLKQAVSSDFTDEEKEKLYGMLKHILGSIVVLFSHLSASSLTRLLDITRQDINQTLDDLHAILDIPVDQIRPFRLHHPSFRDFLLNRERCRDPNFWVDAKQAHQKLAENCIRFMAASLTQDICAVKAPGVHVADVESP